ncbi:ABC transporter permease [Pelodictyon luteolum]|uniref:Putative ABC transporter, integral membrane protein n=1 Tax=Chlorobium luteolum (strain DSM 273 / BCRC 81028 / 2530) TaxID=319225 RepID=Q3B214_CHLL3|nr:FtsX-like permease family protein [Pelodictyon luteolum]ABB24617.1 putative ABC transporter, integral membrane protein [Pelodictyon luteolum DSM 273]
MLKTLFQIAIRHLLGRRRQSLTTIIGVAVSTMVLITTISLTRGLLDSFVETIIDVAPHITLKGEKIDPVPVNVLAKARPSSVAFVVDNIEKLERDEVRSYRRILSLLAAPPYDLRVTAASPYVESQVMLVKGRLNEPLLLKGVDLEREDSISGINGKLTEGDAALFARTSNGLLVGRTVARDMELKLNDEVTIIPGTGPSRQCKVSGIFFSGVNATDNSVYSSLKLAQIIEGMPPDKVSGIALKVQDPLDNTLLARELQSLTGYRTLTWQEANSGVLSLFARIGTIVFSLVAFVGVVSGFGVANILVTTVFEKSRDIAIMKSFGFSRLQLVSLFVLEGFLVGLVGAVLGGILAIGSIDIFASIPIENSQGPISKTGFSMSTNPLYFLYVIGVTVFISTFAAIFPSARAAKLEPVQVLRDSSL